MVIFDLDDTIYDYEYCNYVAEKELFQFISTCFEIPMEQSEKLFYQSKEIVKKQLGNVASSHNRLLYMQALCELRGESPLLYARKFYDIYWDTLLEQIRPFEYVHTLFDFLKAKKIEIGILTDLTAHIQYRKLEKLNLIHYIDHIITSEEVGIEKPSEKIFLKMLSKAGYQPEDVLMIGDREDKDVQGAQNVGMQALLYRKDIDIVTEVKRLL